MAKNITRSYLISLEGFQTDPIEFSKNMEFASSLPTSTSTWCSDSHNGPSRYICGELKLENINIEKAPTRQSYHPAKVTQLSYRI
jgi:hypothetical protein